MLQQHKKDDDTEGEQPFVGVDRATVVQETRSFNNPACKARHASAVLTSLLYVLSQGEMLDSEEATNVFFNVTKLWQSQDPLVRRLSYIVIKELGAATEDAIVVTSSLTKDMTSNVELFKPNAIRTLFRVAEPSMLAQLDRYLKSAIVDKNPFTSSAALVAGYHLLPAAPDLVRRWVGEVQEAATASGRNPMVQYHAVGLLYGMKKGDKLAVSKLVAQLSSVRSPWAHTLLVRFAASVLREGVPAESAKPLQQYLVNCLESFKADMVMLEAARAVCTIPGFAQKDVTAAVNVLQHLVQTMRPVVRFAAVRTLNQIATTQPQIVAVCNSELELLATDQNRSIATLAITTLLKTGKESSVDRLMKQISTFIEDVSDEFKVVVVEGVRMLATKFPERHRAVLTLLGNALREDGGLQFKRALVEAILAIMAEIPAAKEMALGALCDFIEDCEFVPLLCRILNILGDEAPRTETPAKYLRHIYNRVILESATVRAAAVGALAKFAQNYEPIRASVITILDRCQKDLDDEVRDRASLYFKALSGEAPPTIMSSGLDVPLENLERSLRQYLSNFQPDTPAFDIASVPTTLPEVLAPVAARGGKTVSAPTGSSTPAGSLAGAPPSAGSHSTLGQLIPQTVVDVLPPALGRAHCVTGPVALTETQVEIRVEVFKVVCAQHVALVFDITNTLDAYGLANVYIQLTTGGDNVGTHPIAHIPALSNASCVAIVPRSEPIMTGSFETTLFYVLSEDGSSSGEEDEFKLEDTEIELGDFFAPVPVPDFAAAWEQLSTAAESTQTYSLSSMATVEEAVKGVTKFFGLKIVSGDQVSKGARSHEVKMCGAFADGAIVLAVASFALVLSGGGVALNLSVRSSDADVAAYIASSIA